VGELMLVGVGRMGRPYLAAARRLGLQVRAVESVARAAALAGEVNDVRMCEGELDEHWVAAASAAAATGRPGGVVAFSEPQVMAAALLQESGRLPGPGIRAAVLSRNKALQRGTFAAAGVRQPDHLLTDDLRSAADWAGARMPVVVKPLSSSGSSGVELVTDADGYLRVARRRAGEGPLLVEAAVAGPEYSWEALVRNGQVWLSNTTAKETTGPPHFVEVSHRTGIRLAPEAAAQVEGLAAAVLRALRMGTGIVHLEFRLTAAGPTVMEVAVRTPGDFIMDLLGLTYDVDWFELVVRAAMALPLPPPPPGPVRYAASYLPVAAPGVVTRIRGLDEVLGHPAVVHAGLIVAEGDVIRPLRSSSQRAGHVVLAADTPEELEVALAEVRSTLVIRTRPEPVTARVQ
jgi:biotin carboxylase